MKDKIDRELRRKKLSKNQLSSMVEFKDIGEYTKAIDIGEHISVKIRLQETIYPDKKPDINVDIRKFLNAKYPFKGGKQGIAIPKDKWLDFIQEAINFTAEVFGADIFCLSETEPQTPPETVPVPPEKKLSPEAKRRMSIANKSAEEVNWGELSKIARKKN